MKHEKFLEQSYAQRQFVVFALDSDIAKMEKESGSQSKVMINKALDIVPFILPVGFTAKLVAVGASMLVKEIYERYSNTEQSGIAISTLPFKMAEKLNLPIGHPRMNVLYVLNPASTNTYVPVSDFHSMIFESRTCELIKILNHLGAKKIDITHEIINNKNIGSTEITADQDAPQVKTNKKEPENITNKKIIDISANFGYHNNTTKKVIYSGNFDGGEPKPLPDNLAWYHQEQTWQQMVDSRLNWGAKNFSLELNYDEDFGINASLKVKLDDIGLEIGGNFTTIKKTRWTISGEF